MTLGFYQRLPLRYRRSSQQIFFYTFMIANPIWMIKNNSNINNNNGKLWSRSFERNRHSQCKKRIIRNVSIWPFLKLFTNGNFVALLKVVAGKSKLNKQQCKTTKSRIQSIWKDRAQIFFIFTNSKAHETQSINLEGLISKH